jgi:hypothetical protein
MNILSKFDLVHKKYLIFTIGVLLAGCVNTEGTLEIKGKVIDEFTGEQIAGKKIIIQALVKNDKEFVPIDAGQFSSDSSGCFMYPFREVKDVRYYNFCIVGDSNYAFITKTLGLYELEQNAKFLIFTLNKLTDLTIKIYRKSKKPVYDTLSLSWESNGVAGWVLFPYRIDNYVKTTKHFDPVSGIELRWIGGKVNSTVKTRVFAEKRTKIRWDLDRNGKRKEFTDTITCKRDFANIVYFTY